MSTHRLRWQLALGQSVFALALVSGGTVVLASRTDDLRRAEAAIGAARDAEALAEQVAPRLEGNLPADELLTGSTSRQVEVTDGHGHHMSGAVLSADPAVKAAIRRTIDNLDEAATADGVTVGPDVLGLQPMLSDGELIGVVVVSEPTPARRGWRQLFGLDATAAALLALAAGAMGWWLAGRITRPLSRLTEQARSLVLSGTSEPLPQSRITEVAVLGSAIELVGNRIRSEAQRRDDMELDLRRLSHELRTPLTTIRLRLDDLASAGEDAEDDPAASTTPTNATDRTLATIEGQLDRMDRLAEQLSRLRHHRPDAEVIDLGLLAAAAVDRLRPLADWGRVEMRLDSPRPAHVVAERAALEDAISNVIENAIKYSARGSHVTITSTPGADWCVLEVSDQGPGIAAELRDVILRPGVRVVGPNNVRGTGQGLAIVAGTLDRLGGRLEIADARGGGASLRLVLPATAG